MFSIIPSQSKNCTKVKVRLASYKTSKYCLTKTECVGADAPLTLDELVKQMAAQSSVLVQLKDIQEALKGMPHDYVRLQDGRLTAVNI